MLKVARRVREVVWLPPLLVLTPFFLLYVALSAVKEGAIFSEHPLIDDDDYSGFLDGCYHVYLDVGSNVGVQVRKLYQPELYPEAKAIPVFNNYFGNTSAHPEVICSVGFEANPQHSHELESLSRIYGRCGWPVHFFTSRAVSDDNHGNLVSFYSDGETEFREWGASLLKDNVNLDNAASSEVRLLRLSKFVEEAVLNRRIPRVPQATRKPSVIMKIDIEGSEVEVLTDLVLTGTLRHVDLAMVEFHEHLARSKSRKKLAIAVKNGFKAMQQVTKAGPRLLHISELDDEAFGMSSLPLPNCP